MTRVNPLLNIKEGLDMLDVEKYNQKTMQELLEQGWTTTAPPTQVGVPVGFQMIGDTKLYLSNVEKGEK